MTVETTRGTMLGLGIDHICGSVIADAATWEELRALNDAALALAKEYDGFYTPGFHVHPSYIRESCEEIERMEGLGQHLIGELVPYWHGWKRYATGEFDKILDCAEAHRCVVSFHSMDPDDMDEMVRRHPNLVLVAAHPDEYDSFMRHMRRMELSKNYYLDLSGYGIFRHGMLRHGIDLHGAERFLFGSDYPTCNPAMYVGGVELDALITPGEQELIFHGNAERLLGLLAKEDV